MNNKINNKQVILKKAIKAVKKMIFFNLHINNAFKKS